jgi:uncharacterized membrane protein
MFWYGPSFLVFWVLLVMAVFALVHWSAWGGRRPHPPRGYEAPGRCGRPDSLSSDGRVAAEQILAERFARDEIDDEFWRRMTTLRAGRPDGHSAAADR